LAAIWNVLSKVVIGNLWK